jgi:tetratricopeptide (TPR) repeat protein
VKWVEGPEGRQRIAHGVSRGKEEQSTPKAPEGRQKLLPDISLIIRNSVSLQERDEFLFRKRMSHYLSPLRGSGHSKPFAAPRLTPWATLLRPHARAACITSALTVAAISAPFLFGQTSTLAQPATKSLLVQAKTAELKRDFQGAAALYQKLLAAHPNQPEILQRLGLDYYLSGRFADAIPVFTKAEKLDPSLWGSDLFLGISYYRTGRFSEALSPLHRALRLKPDLPEANLWLGSALLAQHQPEAAVPYLRDASNSAGIGAQADSLLIEAYRNSAENYYNRVAKLSPNSYRVDELKAQELAWQGTTVGALLQYQRALSLKPNLEGAHRAMGEIYWQQRQFALAAKEFEAELRVNPMDEESNRRLGEYWVTKGDPARAISYLNTALAVHTQSPSEVYHFLGVANLSEGKLAQAEAALKLAIRDDPREPSNHHLLMQVYLRKGKPEQAAKERALFEEYTANKK